MKSSKKNILVAPLNWGLGHATRCIPIIKALEKNGFTPIIASDGDSLELLRKEFPHHKALELPSYKIKYPKYGGFFKLKMIFSLPKIANAIRKERKFTKKWVKEYNLKGIISDNRYGVFSKKIPTVFITHQLNVISGKTTKITTALHHSKIKKFTECWVPDFPSFPNLSGDLGHEKNTLENIKYIGPLSRMHKKELPKKHDLMIILSGPEPQRDMLEKQLFRELKNYKGETLFVCGVIEKEQKIEKKGKITIYNFMTTSQIEYALNESDLIVCRSGYSSIMDLAQLEKKVFFIPTPGQYEQEYLAKKLKKDGLAPFSLPRDFKIDKLMEADFYKGIVNRKSTINWSELFQVFG